MRQKMDEKQRDINKKTIMNCAKSILEKEGYERISIRKVAKLAGYTEGSIYNYFNNKEALLRELIQEGYNQILKATIVDLDESLPIEKQIIQRFIYYTKTALKMPEYYKTVMLSEDPKILEMTSVLNNVLKDEKRGIHKLESMIKQGMETGEFTEGNPALIARIIWTANFGLTIRLIIENQTNEKEIESLTKEQLGLLFKGLRK